MRIQSLPVLFAAFVLALTPMSYGQNNTVTQSQSSIAAATTGNVLIPAGQKATVEGVILSRQLDSMSVRSIGGAIYNVMLVGNPSIKEKKSNPFRGAQKFGKNDLVAGLQVEIKGSGEASGALAANEIKFTKDDLKVAQTMDTRVVPVENRLSETQTRLGETQTKLSETEQNAQRLSGQMQELSAVSNAARGGAKAAQETADTAMSTATNARQGVQAANRRIASLDDYDIKTTATVHFKAGSTLLSKEDKSELDQIAEQAKNQKGYIIEVAGFASADGNENFNRKLSQKRADAAIQYLAENYNIPMRRFVLPMGYGEKQPVADNASRDGRKENRRVEVRVLASKGLSDSQGETETTSTSMNTR